MPQYQAVFRRWTLHPKLTADQFVFKLSTGAKKIALEDLAATLLSGPQLTLGAPSPLDSRNRWRNNVAAYRIDRLLGLRMVPVTVIRPRRSAPRSPGGRTAC